MDRTGSEAALRGDAPRALTAESAGEGNDQSRVVEAGARREALLGLIREERTQLVRLAYRFCWNWADAEDAVQDSLLLATQRLEQLAEPARLTTWVKSIVVRQSIERVRQRHRTLAVPLTPASASISLEVASDSAAAEADAVAPRIRELIAKLPERQQAALVLREISGMEYAEVAAILEIEESTARVLVRNGREGLRELLLRERD